MIEQLGVDPSTALAVVITTVVVYLAFVVMIKAFGQRSLTSVSIVDVTCIATVGAVVGRTTLLANPTLATGVVALATLLVTRRLLGTGKGYRVLGRLLDRRPVLLVADGRIREDAMRMARVTERELYQRLRLAGVTRMELVAYAVLESNGEVSVLRRDDCFDIRIVADVPGAPSVDGPG